MENSSLTTVGSRACRGCSERSASKSAIDCPSTPAAPWLAFTRLKASQTSRFEISNGFASITGSSCITVGLWPRLNNAAPSVQPHYRTFIPTTGCSAPVLRIGTLALAVLAACGVSLGIGTTGSHVPYESLVELRATYTPDAARAVFRTAPELIPQEGSPRGFDIV